MSLHISLPEGLERLVNHEMASGLYRNVDDLVAEALQSFLVRHSESDYLAPEMQRRVARLEAGDVALRPASEYFDALEQRIQAMPD